MNHYIRDLCKTTIQSTIQERMNDYKSKIPGVAQGFQFNRIVLGRIVSFKFNFLFINIYVDKNFF